MFKISLLNVGSDMITKDMVTTVDSLMEAEIIAKAEVSKCKGVGFGATFKQTGSEHIVKKGNNCVGSYVITGK